MRSFNENELNTVPYEGSWTAAQVARHLMLSEDGMDELLTAPMQEADRQPHEKAGWLKDMFLNFETKMKSPDFIVPEDKHYTHAELEGPLTDIRDKMIAAAETANLAEMAPLPEGHPFEGSTKLEMVHFITYHTMRHNHQMEKIRKAV